jgi:HEAT repeat protein
MMKHILITLLFAAACSQASLKQILPKLADQDIEVRTKAGLDLLATCSQAARPNAEEERIALSKSLCEALQPDSDPRIAVAILENLERIGGAESVTTLAQWLNYSDENIADFARRALVNNPSPQAGQALMTQLKNRKARSAHQTAGLIYGLGERKEAQAVELIIPYLSNQQLEIYMSAIKALSYIGNADAVRGLAKQQAKESGERRIAIDNAMLAISHPQVFQMLYAKGQPESVRLPALLGIARLGGIEEAEAALKNGSAPYQNAVIEAAMQSGNDKLYALVAQHLPKLNTDSQLRALAAIAESNNPKLAAAVEDMLQADNKEVQKAAAAALAHIGTLQSAAALIASGTPEACKALGQLNVEGIDSRLEKIAAGNGEPSTRAFVIEALAFRGREDLIKNYFAYAKEPQKEVAQAGMAAIALHGKISHMKDLTELLIQYENSPLGRDALKAIVNILRNTISPDEAVEILISHMDTASPKAQGLILQALAQSGTQAALAPLINAVHSKNEALQRTAVQQLGNWPETNALKELIALASEESLPLNYNVILLQGITRLSSRIWRLSEEDAINALAACRRPEEKKNLIDAIGRKCEGGPDIRAALKALQDQDELQETIQQALSRMKK